MTERTFPVWACKIGTRATVHLLDGADSPMRRAIEDAFKSVTGEEAEFNFSGWGGALDEAELAVVEKRLPSEASRSEWLVREAAADMLAALEAITQVRVQGHDNIWAGVSRCREIAADAIAKARGEVA